jgi:hypothetical protein
MVETFFVESRIEHLRQHERATNADRLIEEKGKSSSLSYPWGAQGHPAHCCGGGRGPREGKVKLAV